MGELGDGGRSCFPGVATAVNDPCEDRMMDERGFRPVVSDDYTTLLALDRDAPPRGPSLCGRGPHLTRVTPRPCCPADPAASPDG
jgi:hypothetical protein